MEVDNARAAGRLVQPVDVLGQKQLDSAHRLEPGQGAMRIVRQGSAERAAIRAGCAPNSAGASARSPMNA